MARFTPSVTIMARALPPMSCGLKTDSSKWSTMISALARTAYSCPST